MPRIKSINNILNSKRRQDAGKKFFFPNQIRTCLWFAKWHVFEFPPKFGEALLMQAAGVDRKIVFDRPQFRLFQRDVADGTITALAVSFGSDLFGWQLTPLETKDAQDICIPFARVTDVYPVANRV